MAVKKIKYYYIWCIWSIGEFLVKKFFREDHNLLLFVRDEKKIKSLKKKYNTKKFQKIIFEKLDIRNKEEDKKKLLKNKNFIRKTGLIVNTIGIQGEVNNFFLN